MTFQSLARGRSRALGIALALALAAVLGSSAAAEGPDRRPMTVEDLDSLRDVESATLSPDGAWVAYTVRRHDVKEDRRDTDVWMTSWDGKTTLRLTSSPEADHAPRFSPDGRFISFLSSRGEDDQLYLLPRAGGEAEKVTSFQGEVSDAVWSPDGLRLVLVVEDDPAAPGKDAVPPKSPKPIVIDRYHFKEDKVGYQTTKRRHLYLFDLNRRKAQLLTPGSFDEELPAFSPDGGSIAFVSRRTPDPDRDTNYDIFVMEARPGASPRRLTTFDGPDAHPDWESRPAFSPDGKLIAYLQGGPKELIEYAVHKLAVVPVAGGPARILTAALDRNAGKPRFSPDGSFIYFLLEDDRSQVLARIPAGGGAVERLVEGRDVNGFDVGPSGKAVFTAATSLTPFEVFALDEAGPVRPLTRHNADLMAMLLLGTVEDLTVKSKDGMEVRGFLVRPPGLPSGMKLPTVLRIHGGPVSQFSRQLYADWHVLAGAGYAVVAVNPRGSSGRGEAYSKAIYADWGNRDGQDVLAAVDEVVNRGLADPAHLGVGGWSYGGMLTNYVIAQDTRFSAAVSGASISNILAGYGTDEYVRDYELELGPPWKNLNGWLKLSFPFLHADRIVTPTLFLCGEKDLNVPLLNSEQMYQALRSLGRETQLVIYPGQYHSLTKPSYIKDRLQRSLAWYDRFLKKK
jgi:dipeptidyl aminopeptidase/acylaminoacyl peptidase